MCYSYNHSQLTINWSVNFCVHIFTTYNIAAFACHFRYGHYIEGAGSILQMAQHDVSGLAVQIMQLFHVAQTSLLCFTTVSVISL